MNDEHLKQWTNKLRSGTIPQANGVLAKPTDSDQMAMCCLGVGCAEMGYEVIPKAGEFAFLDPDEPGRSYDALPPMKFHAWLGLLSEESQENWADLTMTGDVFIDWPEGMAFIGEVIESDTGANAVHPVDANEAEVGGCAELNDHGFTFEQIADLVDYFGVRARQ